MNGLSLPALLSSLCNQLPKKNTKQSAGHAETTRRTFKNKKSLQISGFGQNNTKSHSEQKNIFFSKKF